ncbi:MAG: hypothetical protein ACLBM6_03360 [Cuspidothrix sp.]|jgi:hypothetical protein
MNNTLLSTFKLQQQLLCLSLLLAERDDDEKKRILIPFQVILSAKNGLELHSTFGGGKNIAVAKMLIGKRPVSLEHINQMVEFFETHEEDREDPMWRNQESPSVDYIRWCLMGGSCAYKWAVNVKRRIREESNINKYIFELEKPIPTPKTQGVARGAYYY